MRNTRQRQQRQHSEPHGRMYLILGGASPRRVPLESAEVRFCPRPQCYQPVQCTAGLPVASMQLAPATSTNKIKSNRIPGSAHPERHSDRPWGKELCAVAFKWCHTRGRGHHRSVFLHAALCSLCRLPQGFEEELHTVI